MQILILYTRTVRVNETIMFCCHAYHYIVPLYMQSIQVGSTMVHLGLYSPLWFSALQLKGLTLYPSALHLMFPHNTMYRACKRQITPLFAPHTLPPFYFCFPLTLYFTYTSTHAEPVGQVYRQPLPTNQHTS